MIAQGVTKLADAPGQNFIRNRRFAPYPVYEFVPLDDLAGPLCKTHKHVHHLWLNVVGAVRTFDQALEGMDDAIAQPESVLELGVHDEALETCCFRNNSTHKTLNCPQRLSLSLKETSNQALAAAAPKTAGFRRKKSPLNQVINLTRA